MPGINSKKGCLTCKRRKKKCDEAVPNCLTCVRLSLVCHYKDKATATPVRTAAVQIGPLPVHSPQTQTTLLPVAQFRPHESSVIARIPSSIGRFLTPTCDTDARETKVLMQMIFTDLTVRNCLVACFSSILPTHDTNVGSLDRESLGSALHLVRSRLSNPRADHETLSMLQIAIQFLGLLESVGPQQSSDPATHWIALALLVERLAQRPQRSPLPYNLRILMLEACVYHFAQLALFTSDIGLLYRAWRQTHLYQLLVDANPEGETRLPQSSLLGGQYEIWAISFEVQSLNRCVTTVTCNRTSLPQQKQRVKQIQAGLGEYFAAGKDIAPVEWNSLAENYHIHCTGLLIGLTMLEESSAQRWQAIETMVSEGLRRFINFKLVPMTYGGLVWPLHILACGISTQDDWDAFKTKADRLCLQLDFGHAQRLRSVMSQAVEARTARFSDRERGDEDDRLSMQFPGVLHLLQQPEGIPWE